MRALALLLVLAAPLAAAVGFVDLDAGPAATCGEGCLALEPGEQVVSLTPPPGARAAWVAESAAGVPLATGVALGPTLVELPAGAARLRVTLA